MSLRTKVIVDLCRHCDKLRALAHTRPDLGGEVCGACVEDYLDRTLARAKAADAIVAAATQAAGRADASLPSTVAGIVSENAVLRAEIDTLKAQLAALAPRPPPPEVLRGNIQPGQQVRVGRDWYEVRARGHFGWLDVRHLSDRPDSRARIPQSEVEEVR